MRVPRHVGFIPDGNRRWADGHGLPRGAGYAAGIRPGLELLRCVEDAGVEEITAYGYTKENARRPSEQVQAFQEACTELALLAVEQGAALLVVGDTKSPRFPDALRPFAAERAPGRFRFNLLVNYNWQWDVAYALDGARRRDSTANRVPDEALGSARIGRVDLVMRWGGRQRLSGFLPLQCAYADFYVVDTLWPDMRCQTLHEALHWYAKQDVTLGG